MNYQDIKVSNDNLVRMFQSGQTKEAEQKVNKFLRLRSREDGFTRAIMPPYNVEVGELTKSLTSDHLELVKDMEPNSSGAMGVPFGTGANAGYMGGPRYRMVFYRIGTDRYRSEIVHLQTYDMDLKELFQDLMLNDIMDEEDRRFIGRVNQMVGNLNETDPNSCERLRRTGARGNVTAGPISREAIAHAQNGLVATYNRLETNKSLLNRMTFVDMGGKLSRDDMGGDIAERTFVDGMTTESLGGIPCIVTNKIDLIPRNVQYFFAPDNKIGDFAILEDVTTFFDQKETWVSMRAIETIALTLKNIAGATRVQYTGSREEWLLSEISP